MSASLIANSPSLVRPSPKTVVVPFPIFIFWRCCISFPFASSVVEIVAPSLTPTKSWWPKETAVISTGSSCFLEKTSSFLLEKDPTSRTIFPSGFFCGIWTNSKAAFSPTISIPIATVFSSPFVCSTAESLSTIADAKTSSPLTAVKIPDSTFAPSKSHAEDPPSADW